MTAHCDCGRLQSYDECCGRWHAGAQPTAVEDLMRSRYSAFVRQNDEYLLRTWHPDTRPVTIDWVDDTQWLQLQVTHAEQDSQRGHVHFSAYFREQGVWQCLHERSRFVCLDGVWFYVDGHAEWQRIKPQRNAPCLCGSGRKGKQCCLR